MDYTRLVCPYLEEEMSLATPIPLLKTLKYEEVYRQEYRDLAEARASIEGSLGKVYNQQRLHSALGYRPPVEFERVRTLAAVVATAGGRPCVFSSMTESPSKIRPLTRLHWLVRA